MNQEEEKYTYRWKHLGVLNAKKLRFKEHMILTERLNNTHPDSKGCFP